MAAVSHWKREFEAWTDMNVVVYQGNKADREIIRAYEWHYMDQVRLAVGWMWLCVCVIWMDCLDDGIILDLGGR